MKTVRLLLIAIALATAPAPGPSSAVEQPPLPSGQSARAARPRQVDMAALPHSEASAQPAQAQPIPFLTARPDLLKKAKARPSGPRETRRADDRPQTEASAAPSFLPSKLGAFDGIRDTGFVPPDTHLAVGIDNLIEVVNPHFGVFRRDGKAVGPQGTLPSFFGVSELTGMFDPKVTFRGGRFYLVALSRDEFEEQASLFVAASRSGNAAGTCCTYVFSSVRGSGDDLN